MKKVIVAVFVLIAFGVGFSTGHKYTLERCAASYGDFHDLEEFTRYLDEEIDKLNDVQRIGVIYGRSMSTTWNGPVVEINVPKCDGNGQCEDVYNRIFNIREDFGKKTIVWKDGRFAGHNFANLRPLAKEIAKKIYEANKINK